MSPLATAIYKQLRRALRAMPPAITYQDLADAIGRASPTLGTHPRSARLHAALGEVTTACRARGLPCLTSLVVRNDSRRPSGGYYAVAHPRVRSDVGRVAAWERELARLIAEGHRFPEVLP